jgi:UDP-N-acetylmuramate: L-alanyl-gamma-D-glutamyl-meso-diaminopimelate ligase
MGVDEAEFYEAIASFKGASKRLEKIAESAKESSLQRFCTFAK